MNASDRRRLVLLLKSKDVRASLKSFLAQPKRFKKPIQREREAKEKKERLAVKKKTRDIWEGGALRAAGMCECGCGRPFTLTFLGRETLDHFDNGTGKTKRQKLATAWKLRWGCHLYRQALWPNTKFWNDKFRAHCERNGIWPIFQHIEHAKLSPDRRLSAVPLGPAVDPGVSSQTKEREC